ncbi:hypothetical protein DQ04_00121050 [Trypanosoma grayi]|uniref:hypothetical protein n=1 Tax=Trypanosoma grayi TaxID=71804 RepID=UPI0004F40031|nr:hypothetical protein DQ04_00121050 [Trypanosoma grayi]KEG15273.1 hypothetical protein DQ04_00121050 [Trypanosoma grayi]
MMETRSRIGDGKAATPLHSSDAVFGPLPAYDDICRFIAEYSGRLPSNVFTGTAPYEYDGCDYALILYAILPSRCIDLSRLCWSTTPLPAQLEANLAVFCEGARGLQLCDAPTSSLHPHHLRSTPMCIVHHIKVQHWLFVLSQRFPPEGGFDAATLRMEQRHAQLGEPRLPLGVTTATVPSSSHASIATVEAGGDDTLPLPSSQCHAVWKAAAIDVRRDTPPSVEATSKSGVGDIEAQQPKSWKNYARPWRSAAATKPVTRQPQRRQHPAQPPAGITTTPVATTASPTLHSLADQWCESERRRLQLKRSLSQARQKTENTLFLNGVVDYDAVLAVLQQKQE